MVSMPHFSKSFNSIKAVLKLNNRRSAHKIPSHHIYLYSCNHTCSNIGIMSIKLMPDFIFMYVARYVVLHCTVLCVRFVCWNEILPQRNRKLFIIHNFINFSSKLYFKAYFNKWKSCAQYSVIAFLLEIVFVCDGSGFVECF